jgi:hypothetical protein
MADLQILIRTGVKATVTFYSGGVATDSGTQVKVDVVRPDGTFLAQQANASDEAGAGVYGYQLAPQAECTLLRLDWTGTIGGVPLTLTTWVEVLGGLLFTIPALRALRVANGTPFAADATPLFSDQQLHDARAAVLDEFEQILGFSPVPRFVREHHNGDGRGSLFVNKHKPTTLLSVTVDGAAKAVGDFDLEDTGKLSWYGGWFPGTRPRNVTVEYVAGWDRLHGKAAHAAMVMAAADLDPSAFSGVVSVSTPDGASYTYEPAETGRGGYQRHTGVRILDRWLNRWGANVGAVA